MDTTVWFHLFCFFFKVCYQLEIILYFLNLSLTMSVFFFAHFCIRKVTVCLYVGAYQGHMLNMLCAMLPVLITSLKAFHSVKEQPFTCLIIQLIGHYSRGTVRKILILQQGCFGVTMVLAALSIPQKKLKILLAVL